MDYHDRVIKLIKERTAELIAEGPKACKAHLIKIGVLNADGTRKEFNQEEFDNSYHPINYKKIWPDIQLPGDYQ